MILIVKTNDLIMIIRKFLILVFLSANFLFCHAETNLYSFTRIDINHGLSNNRVYSFLKDSRGFMWFGTFSGLNRYDGYTFKIFKNIPSDSTSLSDNTVIGLFEDNFGKIWIINTTSFNVYDPVTEKFSQDSEIFHKNIEISKSDITRVIKDNAGNIWFNGNQSGLYVYSPSTDSIIHLKHETGVATSIQADEITSIVSDSENNIWIVGLGGLLEKLDNKTLESTYRSEYLRNIYSGVTDLRLFIDRDDDLWIYHGSSDDGIYFFDTSTGEFRHFHQKSVQHKLSNNIVRSVIQDDKGIVWVGTDHGGINLIDKSDLSVQVIQQNPDDSRSISHNSINALYGDDQGIIWVGTFKKGVCYYHENLFKFSLYKNEPNNSNSLPYNDVNCFQEDEMGNLWIGTNGGGLIYYDREKNNFSQFVHDPANPKSLSNDVIVSMLYDNKQTLWLGTFYGGLNRYKKSGFVNYRHNSLNPNTISNDLIWEIFEDSRGNIWIGTLGAGLDMINKETGLYLHYKVGDTNSIHSNFIMSIIEDRKGNIWVGTSFGVDVFNRKSNSFTHLLYDPDNPNSLSSNLIVSLLEDKRGDIWIATTDGLNRYNIESKTFTRYTKSDGLADNNIQSLLEDNFGNIWMGTGNGISNLRFHESVPGMREYEITNYSELDGLQGKEFNARSAFKTGKGELIFGGPDGFNMFFPEKLTHNTIPPPVVFTNIQILGQKINIGEKVNGRIILNQSLETTNTIELKYSEDVFSIEFSALNYFHPEENEFAYMLEGFNKTWMYTNSSNRKATYTNLDPGEYLFQVRASNDDGVWNNDGAQLRIIILPPFWKTKAAIIFYFVLLLAILIGLRNLILTKERIKYKNAQEKLESQRRHELDLLKIKFFTNVSHEFRTPLSLIITPLEKMIKNNNTNDQNPQLQLIYRNARRLLNLINQLLDFRRMEVQKINLNPSYGNVVEFINEIYSSFSDLAEKKNILFEFKSSKDEYNTFFDHDKLEKIIFNLLSNAFKFTHEEGKVEIDLSFEDNLSSQNSNHQNGGNMIIKVKDTGIGIRKNKIDKIFDRFFQSEDEGTFVSKGSGIGLSLTKEFVQLHEGKIDVESEPGKGSCFTVVLPILSDLAVKPTPTHASFEELDEHLKYKEETEFPVSKKKSLVLLVEDNDDFRFYLKDNLSKKYSIIEASNGREGLKQATANLPDLIVSDIMMPEMDGLELCSQLKNEITTSHIPIILLTARMSEEKRKEGYEMGADEYITKPFSFEILESRMKNLLLKQERMKNSFQKHFKIEPGVISVTSLDEKLMKKTLEEVEKNISNPDFSVEKLSKELGMSRVHLYKKLTALTGKTPIEFIRIMRLKRAAQYLEKSQLTVSEIAYEVGFNDPRYFSRYFKSEYGILPSQYANSKKNS